MADSSHTIIDILDIIVMPLVVVVLGVFWTSIQSRYRCSKFKALARRELQEIEPVVEEEHNYETWKDHLKTDLVHRKIVEDPSQNRDFLLGLDSEFVHWLSGLWSAYETGNARQWIYYMEKLSRHDYTGSADLRDTATQWRELLKKRYPAALPPPRTA